MSYIYESHRKRMSYIYNTTLSHIVQAQCVRRNRLLLIAPGHEHKLLNPSGLKSLDYPTIATGGAEWG